LKLIIEQSVSNDLLALDISTALYHLGEITLQRRAGRRDYHRGFVGEYI